METNTVQIKFNLFELKDIPSLKEGQSLFFNHSTTKKAGTLSIKLISPYSITFNRTNQRSSFYDETLSHSAFKALLKSQMNKGFIFFTI